MKTIIKLLLLFMIVLSIVNIVYSLYELSFPYNDFYIKYENNLISYIILLIYSLIGLILFNWITKEKRINKI